MNKKYLLLIVILLGIVVFITGCNTRDLSRPSTRLVGHWGYFPIEDMNEPVMEIYFGALDEDSVGSFVFVGGGETYYAQYRVLSESGDTVTVGLFIGTDPATETQNYEVAKDGQSMMYESLEYQYLDSKTKP